jgi:hypothetical protein
MKSFFFGLTLGVLTSFRSVAARTSGGAATTASRSSTGSNNPQARFLEEGYEFDAYQLKERSGRSYCTEGYHVTVAMYEPTQPFLAYSDSHADGSVEWKGMTIDLMNQLSIEAGFTYEIDFVGKPGNCTGVSDGMIDLMNRTNSSCPQTFDELFKLTVHNYDIVGPWWTQKSERNMYADFSPAYLANDLRLFALNTVPVPESIDWFNFIRPFRNDSWVLIIFTVVVTGIAIFCSEQHMPSRKSFLKDLVAMEHSIGDAMAGLVSGGGLHGGSDDVNQGIQTTPGKVI